MKPHYSKISASASFNQLTHTLLPCRSLFGSLKISIFSSLMIIMNFLSNGQLQLQVF